jgi:glutamate/tyrosine decarboxylase-like PLP-dependent enzyme
VAELVERCCAMAALLASLLADDGAEVLHQELNQAVVRFRDPRGGDDDGHTRAVLARVQEEGTCYPSGTVWRGVAAIRLSVTSFRSTAQDMERAAAAILAAHRA